MLLDFTFTAELITELATDLIPAELATGGIVIWLIVGLAICCYGLLFEGMFHLSVNQNPQWLANWITALRTMISAMPLLGLLGTIIGLLDIFFALSMQAQTSMSDGIGKALFTTQMGMLMTIPAIMTLWFMQRKVEAATAKVTSAASSETETRAGAEHAS